MRNTFVFATVVCVVCSVLLALTATLLRPRQEYNVEIDQKKNILVALGFMENGDKKSYKDIETLYSEKVQEKVLNKKGEIVKDKTIEEANEDDALFPLYVHSENGSVCYPVEGMGLWSLLQGYFALEKDGKTVAGVTFYEQKETAGLGAEIAKDWFQSNFKGKKILNSKGELVSVSVVKGKAKDAASFELANAVDGISGATITGRGVTDLLKTGLEDYQPYLEKMWSSENASESSVGGSQ